MASIAIPRLTKRFGEVVAVDSLSFDVDSLSFDVEQGTITGFLGPNGAGKTTTLPMLLSLVAPTSGTATGRWPEGDQELGRTYQAVL